jgi:hypothetical protein
MEQLKVKKKDIIIANTLIYLVLAFLFLYLQYAYRHQLSPFSLPYLQKSAELFWYIAVSIIAAWIMIWKHHRHARTAFSIALLIVGFKVVEGLFIEFNKVIVVALFFYYVISYFLYQLLADHLSRASLNPNYSKNDLFGPLLRRVPCTIEVEGQIASGILTNWDEEGCFLKIEEGGTDLCRALPSKINITVHFYERDFVQSGEVVAQSVDLLGVGIKFNETPKDLKIFNWAEFVELVHELGFQPDRLR